MSTSRPALLLLALLAGGAQGAPVAPPEPFTAEFSGEWKGIGVATSELRLRRDVQPDQWIYTWRTSARGIFRLFYSEDLLQTSWFTIDPDGLRPRRYEASQDSRTAKLTYDWDAHRARGSEDGKPLDLELAARTLDVLSIQIEVMQDLKAGSLPPRVSIIDMDEVKEFIYTQEGRARLHTPIGELDTIIVASQRPGNDRVMRLWYAPALGYIPVQAERSRNGKLDFAMRIRSLTRP